MKSALRYLFKSEAARHITTLFALALVAYSLFLFNRGYYWDDCGFVGNTVSVNTRYSNGTLYFPCLSLFKWIRYSDAYPIILKRGLTIISFFAMGTFIYLIAKRNCSLKRYAFWIAAITEVVPIYPHIYTNGNCGYIHCLAMLYFAFWLQTLHSKGCVHGWKRVAVILLSMLYYVKSFEMSSMFVFYALPFIYCFYLYAKSKTEIFNWQNTPRLFLSYCIRNAEFLLLPFIFWIIRIKWFPCTGGYATGYNQISINAIMDSPRLFLRTCHNLLYGYLKFYGMPSKLRTILPLLLFAIYTFIVWRHFEGVQKWLSMAIAAVAVMFLATFAYISVGDIANFDDVWETRWFAPVGLPVSLAIISITGCLCSKCGKIHERRLDAVCALIVAIFTINNLRVGVKFFKEQMKQDNIVYLFSQNDAIRNGQVFTFEETSLCSILSRHYRFYETSGFAWRAFGTRDHLIVYPENAQYIDLYCENKGAGDAKIGDITHRTLDGSIMYKCLIKKADVIKCMLLQLFNPRSYNETVKKLGEIYVLPVGEQTKTK